MHLRQITQTILLIFVTSTLQEDRKITELCQKYDDFEGNNTQILFNNMLLEQYLNTQEPIIEQSFYKIYRIYYNKNQIIVKKFQRDLLEHNSSLKYIEKELNILENSKNDKNVLQMKFCVYQNSRQKFVLDQIEKIYIFQENFVNNIENLRENFLFSTSPQIRVNIYNNFINILKSFRDKGFYYVDFKLTNIFVMDENFSKFKIGNFVAVQKPQQNIELGTPLFLPFSYSNNSLVASEPNNVFSLGINIILLESQPNIKLFKSREEHEKLLKDFLRIFEQDSKLRVLNPGSKGLLQTIWRFILKFLGFRVTNSFQDLITAMIALDEKQRPSFDEIQEDFSKWTFLRTNQRESKHLQIFQRSENFKINQQNIRNESFKTLYLSYKYNQQQDYANSKNLKNIVQLQFNKKIFNSLNQLVNSVVFYKLRLKIQIS